MELYIYSKTIEQRVQLKITDIEETTKYITDRIFYITYKSPKVVPKVPLKDLVPYDSGGFQRKGFSVLHVFFILIVIKRIILRFLLSYNQILTGVK